MAIGSRMGGAYVEVEADTSKFAAQLAKQLKRAMKAAEPMAREGGKGIGEAMVDGILRAIRSRAPEVRAQVRAMLSGLDMTATLNVRVNEAQIRRAGDAVESLGHRMVSNVDRVRRNVSANAAGSAEEMTETAGGAMRRLTTMASTVLGNVKGLVSSFSSSIGGAFMNLAQQTTSVSGVIIMIIKLIATALASVVITDMFISIGREVMNLIGLIGLVPAALGSVAVVAATVMIGMRGMSDAIKEAFTGNDPKKLKEAMKDLSASAKNFVTDVKNAKPYFDKLTKSVQESIFKGLISVVPDLITNLGPALSKGMNQLGTSVGSLMQGFTKALIDPKTVDFLERLMEVSDNLLNKIGLSLTNLFYSLIGAGDASLKSFEDLGNKVAGVIDTFSAWLDEKVASGEFEKWLKDGIQTLKDLKDLGVAVMDLLGTMFDEGTDDNKTFIQSITDLIKAFKEFYESKDGQQALKDIATAGELAYNAFQNITIAVNSLVAAIAKVTGAVDNLVNSFRNLKAAQGNTKIMQPTTMTPSGGGMGKLAQGTITSGPQTALIGESGREAVIPLTNPARARQLANASGLTSMLGRAAETIGVQVFIGNEQLDARTVRVVRATNAQSSRDARYQGLAAATA